MGILAFLILVLGAVVVGVIAEYVGRIHYAFEWAIVGVTAAIAAFLASEYLGTFSAWGPEIDGLFVAPALIGAIVVTAAAELGLRAFGKPEPQ